MFSKEQPLIDLHRHLDGNIRPETTWQLAQQHGIELPVNDFPKFIPFVQIQNSEPDLLSFLKKLDWGVAVLKTLDDCKRIAFENVEDAYRAGIDYAELRFSPYYMAMTHNLPVADVVGAVIDGIEAGVKQYPVKINLIGILSRTFGVEKCQQELTGLLAHKNKIVAIDLAGDEYNYPGEMFVDHFAQVTNAGLHITIHAGEAGDSASVWQAIKGLGAERIGHGVASAQDPELMAYMAANNISIESCLTSNYQTGTVNNLAEHPIRTFLEHGVNVFLNTDDPAVQGIELKDEFKLAKSLLNFSDSEIVQLQKNALDACFLSGAEKKALQETTLLKNK